MQCNRHSWQLWRGKNLFKPYYRYSVMGTRGFKKEVKIEQIFKQRFIELQIRSKRILKLSQIHKKAGATITGTKRNIVISAVRCSSSCVWRACICCTCNSNCTIIGGTAGLSGGCTSQHLQLLEAISCSWWFRNGWQYSSITEWRNVGMISGTGISRSYDDESSSTQDGYNTQ